MSLERIKLAMIQRDGGAQSRAEIDSNIVAEYSNLMEESTTNPFPPIQVVYDGQFYWLWDGFHRTAAADLAGWVDIEAEVRQGTRRDAVLLSCGANASHGLRRTNADKRRAVEVLLNDGEWSKWNNCEISRKCGVSEAFVRSLRTKRSDNEQPRTYINKHGQTATMKTRAIGKKAESPSPETPVTENRLDTPLPASAPIEPNDGQVAPPDRQPSSPAPDAPANDQGEPAAGAGEAPIKSHDTTFQEWRRYTISAMEVLPDHYWGKMQETLSARIEMARG